MYYLCKHFYKIELNFGPLMMVFFLFLPKLDFTFTSLFRRKKEEIGKVESGIKFKFLLAVPSAFYRERRKL